MVVVEFLKNCWKLVEHDGPTNVGLNLMSLCLIVPLYSDFCVSAATNNLAYISKYNLMKPEQITEISKNLKLINLKAIIELKTILDNKNFKSKRQRNNNSHMPHRKLVKKLNAYTLKSIKNRCSERNLFVE